MSKRGKAAGEGGGQKLGPPVVPQPRSRQPTGAWLGVNRGEGAGMNGPGLLSALLPACVGVSV